MSEWDVDESGPLTVEKASLRLVDLERSSTCSVDARHNLPTRLSTFIGRVDERAELDALVRDYRLVTITGAGGSGKTRLALRTAAELVDDFDGVWWAELAHVTDEHGVTAAVADAVAARLDETTPHVESIVRRLETSRSLVVVDNCEHVLAESALLIATVLERCPEVTVLATSRASIDVPGERTWRVPPLSSPQPGRHRSDDDLTQYDAVRLFVDRARTVRSSFTLASANSEDVAAICHRLDGIPLALELAAARLRTLTVAQVRAGLDDALGLLRGGSHLLPARQQTLDASIEWSIDLLDDEARALLSRLSVFNATFDLAGAEGVCAGEGLDRCRVLDALDALVDNSLVTLLDGDREGRFLVLETIRQFAATRLQDEEAFDGWRAAHARYFADLAEALGPGCETSDQFDAVAGLRSEHANLVAALEWLHARSDGAALAALVLALGPFWDVEGSKLEGAIWVGRTLDVFPEGASVVQARLRALRGECRLSLGDILGALEDADAAMRDGQALSDATAAGRGSSTLATVLCFTDLDAWRPVWESTVALLTESDDMYALAGNLTWGGAPLIARGQIRAGIRALEEARPVVAATGQPLLVASQQVWEGHAALWNGQPALAEALGRTALSSGALSSLPRRAGAEVLVELARQHQGLASTPWRELSERAEQARRDDERLAAGMFLVAASNHALEHEPAVVRDLVDRWVSDRPNPVQVYRAQETFLGALAAFALGDLDDAHARAELALRSAAASHAVLWIGRAKTLLAAVALARSQAVGAEGLVREAIAVHLEAGNPVGLCEALDVLSAIATTCGDDTEAARLVGAIATRRAEISTRRVATFDEMVLAARDRTRRNLGDRAFDASYAAGAALSADDLVAYVNRTRGTRGRPAIGWDALTPTELQVAHLVHEGLTNKEIAVRLLMGVETVKTHLSHIFAKLDTTKRSRVAAVVAEHSAAIREMDGTV